MIYQYNENAYLKGNNLYKKYPHDAGWDIKSPNEIIIKPVSSVVINTGLHIYIPPGLKGIIQSRSGLSMNFQIESGNAGVIDSGFTGECKIRIYNNHSFEAFKFNKGDRIAQIVFDLSLTTKRLQTLKLWWKLFWQGIPQQIPELDISKWPKTDRANNGYGSTGMR